MHLRLILSVQVIDAHELPPLILNVVFELQQRRLVESRDAQRLQAVHAHHAVFASDTIPSVCRSASNSSCAMDQKGMDWAPCATLSITACHM